MRLAGLALLASLPGRAVIDHTLELPRMVVRILRRTPDAGDAELTATTHDVVVRTINPAPRVATAHLDAPAGWPRHIE